MTVTVLEQHKVFEGRVTKYRHYSKTLACEMTFTLFVPKTEEKVPLIWWLSGLTCTDDNFNLKSGFHRYAAQHQVAVVMPDTSPRGIKVADSEDFDLGQGASFYLNATQAPWAEHFRMYDYLTKELPELVYSLFSFNGNESIMGHSMGGHGALMIGLKNPERFKAISAFAPISNPINVPWGQKAFRAYLGENQADWSTWDATELIKGAQSQQPILITQGTADDFYERQLDERAFLAAAKEAKTRVVYQKESGYDHSYFTISTFIEEHLVFHKEQLRAD